MFTQYNLSINKMYYRQDYKQNPGSSIILSLTFKDTYVEYEFSVLLYNWFDQFKL